MIIESDSPRSTWAGATGGARRVVLWAFYGGLSLLLLTIVTGLLAATLPSLATRISYNSEAYLFALVLGGWIQFGLPRLTSSARIRWAVGLGALWALVGIGLLASDLPSRIRTLNEPAIALALLIPYVSLPRQVARHFVWAVPLLIATTIWAVVRAPDGLVIDQAETFGFVVLAILTFDVFDRRLLQPDAYIRRTPRWIWYGLLTAEPIVVSALGTSVRDGDDPVALLLRYLGRIHESFIGILLLALILHLVTGYRGVRPKAS